jgi:hypothetical protein
MAIANPSDALLQCLELTLLLQNLCFTVCDLAKNGSQPLLGILL